MIRGLHAMFFTSEPEALRAFFRDKLGFTGHDVEVRETEWGYLTSFRVPGNFEIGLYQPKYRK